MEREHVLGVWAQTLPGSKRAARARQWVASLGELLLDWLAGLLGRWSAQALSPQTLERTHVTQIPWQ
jgi:hypothetical protein